MAWIDRIERIVEKICYWRWALSYDRIKNASLIDVGDPILWRIFFDALVQLIAHVVAYVGLAILIVLIFLEIAHAK